MLCILNDHTAPYFNLALEEYLLKEFDEECFMLWRNEPSIIVGKNQNIRILGDFFSKYDISRIERALVGVKHEERQSRKSFLNFIFRII